jgi:hypothetical protein
MLAAGAALWLGMAGPLGAQEPDWYEVTARRQTDGVRSVVADIRYAVGELRIFPAREGLLYDAHLRYDARRFEPKRKWSVAGSVGTLHLGVEGTGEDIDWQDLEIDDDDLGFLAVGLSQNVDTELVVEVGAALTELDLGGIPLTRVEYRTGASQTDISFQRPNPARIGELDLAAGAADFSAYGLGNARFDHLIFQGAVGDITLDFTGAWTADGEATIKMGLGELTLRVPHDLGVRIRKSGFLAAFDKDGFQKVDGAFQTLNWESARYKLDIELKAVLGAIDVEFVG